MNKIEIEKINKYCHTISDLCNEINYGFEYRHPGGVGKYIAYFDLSWVGWVVQIRENKVNGIALWRMEIGTLKLNNDYEPTAENFEKAIAKLQEYNTNATVGD